MTPGPAPAPSHDDRLTVVRPRRWPDIGTAIALGVLVGLPTAISDESASILTGPAPASMVGAVSTLWTAAVLAAAVGMPLAAVWRASRPVGSAVAVYLLALLHFVLAPSVLPIDVTIFLALYSVTVHGPRWAERTALVGAWCGALVAVIALGGEISGLDDVVSIGFATAIGGALVTLAWGAGLLRRSQAARRESLRDRAERLERERDQQAGLAVIAERTRIAREMHDVVAHSLSVMIAQADGGRYAGAGDPDAATRALDTIAETGRAALADTRRILGVLRDEHEAGSLAPAPANASIEPLLDHLRQSGIPVSQVEVGIAVGLPPSTSAALYRIVQESLTNVLKHGGPGVRATVMTEWRPGTVRVVVSDNGRGAASLGDGLGHGLIGMRERAVMLGGSLTAGPGPGGGFRVEALIPTGSETITS